MSSCIATTVRWSGYEPNPAELSGLVELPIPVALDLFRQQTRTGSALLLDATTRETGAFTVSEATLLPARYFDYYLWIAESIDALNRGTPPDSLAPPTDDRENA